MNQERSIRRVRTGLNTASLGRPRRRPSRLDSRLGAVLLGGVALLLGAASAQAIALPQDGADETSEINLGARFMRTKDSTIIRNFEDENGAALATLPAGTLVRVFRESRGKPVFSEVEVAGGVPVWVYGRYLQPTDVDGVLLVTGKQVNMRPMPNLTPAAMPLRSKLDVGERVKLIERANKSVAFGEDWIRIQSPSSTKAWVRSDALEPVADARKASAEWLDRNVPLPMARPAVRPRPASPAGASSSADARPTPASARDDSQVPAAAMQALIAADKAFEAASDLQVPDVAAWRDVVDAYQAVIDQAPASSLTHQKAVERLGEARVKMEFVELREEYAQTKRRSDAEIERIDRIIQAQQKRKTARWGRFEERGWLESRNVGGDRRWYLVFGGETVAEVRCLTQRYDLDVFEGFELGIIGREIAPVVRATATSLPEARVVDAQRIEVISARGRVR